MEKFRFTALLFATSLFIFSASAEDFAPNEAKELKASNEVKMGWTKTAKVGVNVSITSNNENVIGQQEGDSKTYGINAEGGFNYKTPKHESRTDISMKAATTTAPPINRYIKSSDELSLSSIYLYSLDGNSWLGPYARVKASTSIFKGEHIQEHYEDASKHKKYEIDGKANANGQPSELNLTDAFKPLTTRESVGLFAKIIRKKDHQLMFRLGFGSIQISAKGQKVIADDSKTADTIELKTLADSSSSGLEFGFDWKYNLDEKTSFTASLDTLTPGGSTKAGDVCDNCSGTKLTDVDFSFKLNTKIYDFISLSSEYKFKRQPKLVRGDQKQILTLLNFSYTLL